MSQISLILSSESRITRIKGLLGFILSRLNEMCYWSMISCYLIAILFRQHDCWISFKLCFNVTICWPDNPCNPRNPLNPWFRQFWRYNGSEPCSVNLLTEKFRVIRKYISRTIPILLSHSLTLSLSYTCKTNSSITSTRSPPFPQKRQRSLRRVWMHNISRKAPSSSRKGR